MTQYIDHVKNITLKELVGEMTQQCDWAWCNIMDWNPYDYMGWMSAGLYVVVLIVPILILVISVACIATNKTCCVTCHSWSCCCCQICTSTFSIMFLAVTMISPMMLNPITN